MRQYSVPDRLDTFIREAESEDVVMCFCNGTSSFCVKHYADKFARQTKKAKKNVSIMQADENGLRLAMWSSFCGNAYDNFAIPSSGGTAAPNEWGPPIR